MSFEETGIRKIREKLELAQQCVLLAQLGELLEESERPAGKLIDALRKNGIEIKYGFKPMEIYGCLPGQDISSQKEKYSQNPLINTYRRAILLAFTKVTKPGEKIFFCFDPKISYVVVKEGGLPPVGGVPIEEKFRLTGIDLTGSPDVEVINNFEKNLSQWVLEHGLNKERLRWNEPYQRQGAQEQMQLLRDLIEAQEPELRSRIVIPGSIIIALLKIR